MNKVQVCDHRRMFYLFEQPEGYYTNFRYDVENMVYFGFWFKLIPGLVK